MFAEIYKSTSPRRTTLRAVFKKGASWGEERNGHVEQNWEVIGEVNLAKPDRMLPFSADEAAIGVQSAGVFLFQVVASELEQAQHMLLNNYRLKFTLPIFLEPPRSFELLGTGTLLSM